MIILQRINHNKTISVFTEFTTFDEAKRYAKLLDYRGTGFIILDTKTMIAVFLPLEDLKS